MDKHFYLRDPEGHMRRYYTAADAWSPTTGQDVAFLDELTGGPITATVADVTAVYTGTPARDTDRLTGAIADGVYLKHLEVRCERNPTPAHPVTLHQPVDDQPTHTGALPLRKTFHRRGPDGKMHHFHTAADTWSPVPGQDIAFVDVLRGAGWVTVAAIRPIYLGSLAHTEMAKLVAGQPAKVHLQTIEVFCEDKKLPGEPGYTD